MTTEFPDNIKINVIHLVDLPDNWSNFSQMQVTQTIGATWIKENKTMVLQMPSSIIPDEINYLINANHIDFKFLKLIKIQPFIFDARITFARGCGFDNSFRCIISFRWEVL